MDKDITQEVKELQKRINELEKTLSTLLEPLQKIQHTTQHYLKIVQLLLEHGGITPDLILPEIKDMISQEIVRVLLDQKDQNISQITERLRGKRGTASRRIVRDKLTELEEKKVVVKSMKGSRYVYNISSEVLKKWSRLLGFPL